jgi:hypothetical protein
LESDPRVDRSCCGTLERELCLAKLCFALRDAWQGIEDRRVTMLLPLLWPRALRASYLALLTASC